VNKRGSGGGQIIFSTLVALNMGADDQYWRVSGCHFHGLQPAWQRARTRVGVDDDDGDDDDDDGKVPILDAGLDRREEVEHD
jgi:hypothetical protein